ncbi:MAG: thioester domain-containing protein [Candidatus Dormibacteraeota bacterium]|nr:thioester domain-containing protein [Candidatus Dormibacteraeota bacterium]
MPGSARRRWTSLTLVLVGLAMVLAMPVLAEPAPTYRLQGADLAQEFLVQPYWLTPGTVGGHHVGLEAGLLGFGDGAGITAAGYCIDARTHRRHDAAYQFGGRLDPGSVANSRQVQWLLANAYPNGPAALGSDPRGLARTSSAVQAAIWHFSDGFDLDPVGTAQVDIPYRRAFDSLVEQASRAPARIAGQAAIAMEVPRQPAAADVPTHFVVRVTGDDGQPAVDGTEVAISSDGGRLGRDAAVLAATTTGRRLNLSTVGGGAEGWLAATSATVTVTATTSVPVPPGRVLLSSQPTQRLVETGWGRRRLETVGAIEFAAPPPTSSPSAPAPATQTVAPPVRATPPAPPLAPTVTTTVPAAAVPVGAPSLPRAGRHFVAAPVPQRHLPRLLRWGAGPLLIGSGLLVARPRRAPRRGGVRC